MNDVVEIEIDHKGAVGMFDTDPDPDFEKNISGAVMA